MLPFLTTEPRLPTAAPFPFGQTTSDKNLLRRAIENVVRNAIRHTPENTSVEVSLETENNVAIITIKDYGAGVPEKDLQNLFQPFFRLDEARDRKSGGIGLGLAITQRAINAHNGTVTAINVQKNGFIVKIELPIPNRN